MLFAESGAGKSILAMQIAESIARGRPLLSDTETGRHREAETRFPASAHHSVTASLPVLYLDLERSDAQFNARYRCPSPIPGRLPVKYRFSHQLRRTGYGDLEIPEAFNGNLGRYFLHSLKLTIDAAPEKVIVIDNLSCLDPRASGTAAAVRSMRSLKLLATIREISILVITHAKPRRYHRSSLVTRHLSLNDIALGPHIGEIADSVFALGRSTFGEDIRYIKHLKSNFTPPASDVAVFRLERSTGPQASPLATQPAASLIPQSASSPPARGGVAAGRGGGSPQSEGPFLGFTYLGPSSESDLLRDYEREYREAETSELARLKRARTISAREALVDGILSGDYQRYLKR